MDYIDLNIYLSFVLLLVLSIKLSADPLQFIDITKATDNIALSEQAYFLKGDEQFYDVDEVVYSSSVLPWQFAEGRSPNFGINTKTHWFRVDIKNTSDSGIEKLLSLNSFMPRDVSIYQRFEDGSVNIIGKNMGFVSHYDNRPIADNTIVFRIALAAHAKQTLFFQFQALSSSSFELYIHNEDAFHYRNAQKSLFNGFSYGFYVLAFIACLYLYLLSGDRNFFLASLLVFSILISQIIRYGHAYQMFPNSGPWMPWLWYLACALFILSLCRFTTHFNRLHIHMPRLNRCINIGMWLFTVPIVLAHIFDWDLMANIFNALFIPLTWLLLLAVFVNRKSYPGQSSYFIAGLASLCLAILLEVLRVSGIFSAQGFVIYFVLAGVFFMVALFSIAIGLKYLHLGKKSALRLIEKERQLMKAEKAELNADRTNAFLATMSHEIRTPINGVLGMSEILAYSGLSAQQRYYNNLVLSSGKTLLCIIDDILDFSKLQSDKLKIESIDFNLDEILANTLGLYSPQASKKNIHLFGYLHPDIPINCIGDPHRLQQVINNLISNAVKFTQCGEVEFALGGKYLSKDRFELHLTVRDSGIGIAKEQIDDLFNAFEQADTSTSRKYGGTGLGLAISKRLINLMQGDISVVSEVGKGSCFSVSLVVDIAVEKEKKRQQYFQRLVSAKILLINQSPYQQGNITDILRYWGVQVEAVASIRDAYNLLANSEKHFDLAILGLFNKPEADFEPLQNLLQDDFAVICLLGATPDSVFPDALIKQMHLLPEAPTSTELLNTLVSCLDGSNQEAVVYQAPKQAFSSDIQLLVAEDNIVNQQVITAMAKKLGFAITLAENGTQALALYRAQTSRFSGILMDCEMPEMDGYTAAMEIRAFEKAHQLPAIAIVALTAHVLPENTQRCLDSGINDVLSKPINLDQLSCAVNRWFEVAPAT